MKHVFQSIWWWTRVLLLAIVGAYALALLSFNANARADVWYWPGRPAENTSIIALVLASFIAGGLVCTIGWALFSAWVGYRRTRELRRQRMIAEQREAVERKAAMLRIKPPPQPVIREAPKPVPPPPPPRPPEPQEPEPIIEPLVPAPPASRATVSSPPPPAEPQLAAAALAPPTTDDAAPPITVEAHRTTPFASQPIAPGAKAATDSPDIVEEPTAMRRRLPTSRGPASPATDRSPPPRPLQRTACALASAPSG
jgi:hypothetical protein